MPTLSLLLSLMMDEANNMLVRRQAFLVRRHALCQTRRMAVALQTTRARPHNSAIRASPSCEIKTNQRVQLAAEGIAELASNDRNQVFIAQVAGVVAGLSSILRSGPDHAKRSAARAIGHLVCDHDENKVLVAQAAGVLEGLATHRVKTHSRTIWKGVEREVKRIELDTKAAELDKREQEKVVDNQSSGSGSTDNQADKDPTSCHTKDCDFAVVVDDHNAASMVASLVKFVRNRSFRLQEA